ncbi:MAG: hypothetical protein M1820_001607 [Bogoriella megaspora]|nr:MAG: hypothetical protein M1820_001607 [Bogoriella megaspora]
MTSQLFDSINAAIDHSKHLHHRHTEKIRARIKKINLEMRGLERCVRKYHLQDAAHLNQISRLLIELQTQIDAATESIDDCDKDSSDAAEDMTGEDRLIAGSVYEIHWENGGYAGMLPELFYGRSFAMEKAVELERDLIVGMLPVSGRRRKRKKKRRQRRGECYAQRIYSVDRGEIQVWMGKRKVEIGVGEMEEVRVVT